ncbi:heme peroxidase family protein [Flavobacterium sp. SUN052]|uniref:peroxidase family protein n=1 Tax=Flavobacterium sp. SUN052 TaxID=3002441 RepID=UPI00237EA5EF|nr:heme peroxidase family protein [Flavobacterium sp. SUN052]MEC4003705.1 heme peroxidase family protein [Flavobacterium sp. SUN052]
MAKNKLENVDLKLNVSNLGITKVEIGELTKKMEKFNITPTIALDKFAFALKKINPNALVPLDKLPTDVKISLENLKNETRSFHGAKISLSWFPFPMVSSPCSDKFGYLTSSTVRQSSKLDFNIITIGLMNQLGNLMGASGRDSTISDSIIPSGYTYFGQFVDHDVTLDVSSNIDVSTDATTINNMRSPRLDLDNVYGRGPALDPHLYEFPSAGPSTAIKLKLGKNTNTGSGGPSTSGGGSGGMSIKLNADVPRVEGTNTAIIGDPRNDENLIVSQIQMTMLKFHNAVVDLVTISNLSGGFDGDIFIEAKKIVTQHYQWAVVNDYLVRICGASTVTTSLSSVVAPIDSAFSMPVEFSVAAYRFGHSIIRDNYWVTHNLINRPLSEIFSFIRKPNLPVNSNWVIDFNAFFDTGVVVPVNNKARKIDSVLSSGLSAIPGLAVTLASRNLRRGLAMGLPSGQATATALGITPMTPAQLTSGLQPDELTILNSNGGLLLTKTPLWYYILREAAVLSNGNTLGPVGGKIVADTFIKMLKRDSESYLNKVGGFSPFLSPSGVFTVADIIKFAGVNVP